MLILGHIYNIFQYAIFFTLLICGTYLIFLLKQVLFILQSPCFFWDSSLILSFNSFSFVRHISNGMLHRPKKRDYKNYQYLTVGHTV